MITDICVAAVTVKCGHLGCHTQERVWFSEPVELLNEAKLRARFIVRDLYHWVLMGDEDYCPEHFRDVKPKAP